MEQFLKDGKVNKYTFSVIRTLHPCFFTLLFCPQDTEPISEVIIQEELDPANIKEERHQSESVESNANANQESDEKQKLIDEIVELRQQQQQSFFELQAKNKKILQLERRVSVLQKQIEDFEAKENVFVVKRIIGHKIIDKAMHFLVQWEGYDAKNNTWEPETNFICTSVLDEYKKTHKLT